MNPLKVLSLDLDDTLLDGSRRQESIVRTCETLAQTHRGLDATRLVAANDIAWRSYWPELEERWTLGKLDTASIRLEAWRITLRSCGCDDDSIARFASGIHSQFGREGHRLFSDASELLASAREAAVPLVLVTNGATDTQREKLRILKIENLFEVIVVAGEVGIAKPDPSVFDLALKQFAAERGAIWHIGDNLDQDVAGAKAAGLHAVWLNRSGAIRSHNAPEPDLEISSLSEVRAFLRR